MASRPTPYSIALAALIVIHCEENSPLYSDKSSSSSSNSGSSSNDDDDNNYNSKDALFAAVDAFVQQCLLQRPNKHPWTQTVDASITSLLHRLSLQQQQQITTTTTTAVAHNFWQWLNIAASNVDAFMDLMLTTHRALQSGSVDVESANGIFLRSITLGYHQLSFEATVELFKAFAVEVRQAEHIFLSSSSHVNTEKGQMMKGEGKQQQQLLLHNWTLSAAQQEDALRDECLLSAVATTGAAAAAASTAARSCFHPPAAAAAAAASTPLSDDQMTYHLKQILALNPELPSGHFLRFLHCLRTGERVGAMEALHEYMDYYYAVVANTTGSGSSGGNNATTNNTNIPNNGEILQFAAILKAALHQATGDPRLSRAATDEAVRVAQQSHDTACVAFALGWLSVHAAAAAAAPAASTDTTLAAVDTTKQAQELMERCVQRATEGNLRNLAAGANLSLAVASLQTTAQNPASRAWKYWNDAAADPPTTDAANTLDRPTHMTHLSSGEDAAGIMARQQLVAAGIWETFGKNALARLASATALQCHEENMTVQDKKIAVKNIARSALFGTGTTTTASSAFMNQKQVPSNTMNSCVYGNALKTLHSLHKKLSLGYESDTMLDVSLLLHEWAVRRGEFDHAASLMVSLQSQLHPRAEAYEDVCIDIASQRAFLQSRQGYVEKAVSTLRDVISKCKVKNQQTRVSELLLQLARIHMETDKFTNSLSPLTECLELCQKHEQDTLHAAALALFAHLHLRMGNPRRAIGIIRAVLPSLLENGHITWQGEAYLALAKSYLEMANSDKNDSLNLAVRSFKQCENLFLKCQDCLRLKEVYYLLARACAASPVHKHHRDKYAQNFLDMKNLQLNRHSLKTVELMSLISKPDGIVDLASRALSIVPVS